MVEVIGQDRAWGHIHAALTSGRFHHAWIFHGPRGVGKRTTAVEVARILLSPDVHSDAHGRLTADPAGETSRLINAGTHPDLHLIQKELALFSDVRELRERKLSNIPLDLLRERVFGGETQDGKMHDGPAYRTPMLGHGKVFIIDEAELLEPITQNAFLKTLEEPPQNTYFILVTSRLEALLPTIRSRCQQVAFGSLSEPDMKKWAARSGIPELASGGSGGVGANVGGWVIEHADGSPGAALVAQEYGFFRWHQAIEPMMLAIERGGYAVSLGETLGKLSEEFAEAWVKAHKNASKDAANKDGARYVMGLLAGHARRKLQTTAGDEDAAQRWINLIHLIRAAERQMESNVAYKIVLENLVAQWAANEPAVLALVE